MQHLFDVEIAKHYGVNIAIFIKNIGYWIQYNQANNQHFYDGRYWTYNTIESFSQIFPYWSVKQIRTIINNAMAHKLLIKGDYNKAAYDHTLWYSLTDDAHKLLNLLICPNGQIDEPKRADRCDQKGKPIPYNKHINKHTKSRGDRAKNDAPPPLSFSDRETEKPSSGITEESQDISNMPFTPDRANVELASRLGVDLERELKSFLLKSTKPKTQAYFEQWLQGAKDYKNRKSQTQSNEIRSTVPEYGPGHPVWELHHGHKQHAGIN